MKKIILGLLVFLAQAAFAAGAVKSKASKPVLKPFEGIITQINAGDGSFVMRMRDGKYISVPNPVGSGSFVSVRGTLSADGKSIENLESIARKDTTAADSIPQIESIEPGVGWAGQKVAVRGYGFLKSNAVIIGSDKIFSNAFSPDGKTIYFALPAYLKDKPAGDYEFSVSNKNGVSNIGKFTLQEAPALQLRTISLPQLEFGKLASVKFEAVGGADSYNWKVQGAIPPGMKFSSSVCIAYPCQAPAALSGKPSQAGIFSFTVTLKSGRETISREYQIKVPEPLSAPY